jgi:hypothetical protein
MVHWLKLDPLASTDVEGKEESPDPRSRAGPKGAGADGWNTIPEGHFQGRFFGVASAIVNPEKAGVTYLYGWANPSQTRLEALSWQPLVRSGSASRV